MHVVPSTTARDRVLFLLKTRGPRTAADLARLLGVTPMAVRQHLAALAGEGLVSSADERRKVGRPARLWSLTEVASRRFPDTHGELTVELLKAVRTVFGDDGLQQLVTVRGQQQRATYAARMPAPGASIEQKVAALAAIRSEEGYMAEWSRDDDGAWTLAENHCPVCAAATACQGLCRDELAMFRELFGHGVEVARSEHLLAGARRCAYRIIPASPAAVSADETKAAPPPAPHRQGDPA